MGLISNTKVVQELDADGILQSEKIETTTSNFQSVLDEGYFIKLYQPGLEKLLSLPEVAIRLWMELANRSSYADITNAQDYGGQLVTVRSDIRQVICNKLKIAESTYYNNIQRLINEKCIRKIVPGTFQINPSMIGKGLYNYSSNRGYGGINILRKCYDGNRLLIKSEVTRDVDTIYMLEEEISACYARMHKLPKKERERLEKDISLLKKDRDKLNKEDYVMLLSYLYATLPAEKKE